MPGYINNKYFCRLMSTKIISLVPSVTEIICALGIADQLVGRSLECNFPPSVLPLPICGYDVNFINYTGNYLTGKQGGETGNNKTSGDGINHELLDELDPDFLFIPENGLAAVNSSINEKKINSSSNRNDKKIISIKADSINDLKSNIHLIAKTLGVENNGLLLIEDLEERIELIRHKLKYIEAKSKTAIITRFDPLMVSGNLISELVEIAGGKSINTATGNKWGIIKTEDLSNYDPDMLLLMPAGFSIDKTLKEIDSFLSTADFNQLKALKNNQLFIADGRSYFNYTGPSIINFLEILAEIINPKQFSFGYEGTGWIKFSV